MATTPKKSVDKAIDDFDRTFSNFNAFVAKKKGVSFNPEPIPKTKMLKAPTPKPTLPPLPAPSEAVNLAPEASDFVVYAINHLEQHINELIEHTNERNAWAEHRDDEHDAQLGSLGDAVTFLNEELKELSSSLSDIKDIKKMMQDSVVHIGKIEKIVEDFEKRISTVEACKVKVEQHISETQSDHYQLDRARVIWYIVKWVLISLSGIAGTIAGIIPLLEHFSK